MPTITGLAETRGEDAESGFAAGSGLGRRAQATSSLAHACADGPRARAEPEKTRQDRQSSAGVVEGAAASVHRAPLSQEVRPGKATAKRVAVGVAWGGRRSVIAA